VFHSDGIAETANAEGQFFGTTRLMRLIEKHHELTATEIADLVLREVDWFTQNAPLSDDRTLVVLKVK
jgi:phosphoserine phosphatase RsbU/P